MRMSVLLLATLFCASGCADESRRAPVSSVRPNAAGPGSTEPESANSLPLGSAVNRPLTQPMGNVGTIRVSPAR